jgi:hypothetical protein
LVVRVALAARRRVYCITEGKTVAAARPLAVVREGPRSTLVGFVGIWPTNPTNVGPPGADAPRAAEDDGQRWRPTGVCLSSVML